MKLIRTLLVVWVLIIAGAGAGVGRAADTTSVTEAVVNAPIDEIWRVFTSTEGLAHLGLSDAHVELRIGGRIRGRHTDGSVIEHEVLAYEPGRMLATRVAQASAGTPQVERRQQTWTVIHFASIAGETTHVRIVGLGYDDSAAAQELRQATEAANRAMLDALVKHYRPGCALCEKPK